MPSFDLCLPNLLHNCISFNARWALQYVVQACCTININCYCVSILIRPSVAGAGQKWKVGVPPTVIYSIPHTSNFRLSATSYQLPVSVSISVFRVIEWIHKINPTSKRQSSHPVCLSGGQTLFLLPLLQDHPEVHNDVLYPAELQAVPHLGHARTYDSV